MSWKKNKSRTMTWKPKDLEEGGTEKALTYLSIRYPHLGDGALAVTRLLDDGMRVFLFDGSESNTRHESLRATLLRKPRDFHLWILPLADGLPYVEMKKGADESSRKSEDDKYQTTAFLTISAYPTLPPESDRRVRAALEIAFRYPPDSFSGKPGFDAVEAATAFSKRLGARLESGNTMGFWMRSTDLERSVSLCVHQTFPSLEDAVKWAADSMDIAKKGLM